MVTKEKEDKEEIGGEELFLYELGYQLLPTIAEETLIEEVSKIRTCIESQAGILVSDGMPTGNTFSYPLEKRLGHQKKLHQSGYFGWMRFRLFAKDVYLVGKEIKGNESIIRFLLVRTVPERAARPPKKMKFFDNAFDSSKEILVKKVSVMEKSASKELSEDEIERTIEELVVE